MKKLKTITQLATGTVISVCVLLALLSVIIGSICYFFGVLQNGAALAKDVGGILSSELEDDKVRALAGMVREVSEQIPQFEIEEYEGSFRYIERFAHITGTEEYQEARFHLKRYNENTERVSSVYLVIHEPDKDRLVYICDGYYGNDKPFYPGVMDNISDEAFRRADLSVSELPALEFGDGKIYSYGLVPWYADDGSLICYVGTDVAVDGIARGIINYIVQITIAMGLASLVVGIFAMNGARNDTRPVKELTEAAEKYLVHRDKLSKKEAGSALKVSKGFFSGIQSGNIYEYSRLVTALKDMEQGLDEYVGKLIELKSEAERSHADMRLAAEIQEKSLPSVFPPFPERDEFDIFASMSAAKDVGGDFYDFYFIDDDHLALVIADVSGKGFPAALVMMATKIIIAERAKFGGTPAQILTDVNARLTESSRIDMFVTAWLGILELSTGKLQAANAGHEYPMIKKKDGSFTLVKDVHGFVLGGMEDVLYKDYEMNLESGDVLYVYTDGVAEATDSRNCLFGTERMIKALDGCTGKDAKSFIQAMDRSVSDFVGQAPQFDDLTQMCIRYDGSSMKKITVDAVNERFDEVFSFVDGILRDAGSTDKARRQVDIAVEEIFTNICKYAYGDKKGKASVSCGVSNGTATVVLADRGVPYNPLKNEDPDITLSADERQIGGLGIFMVKKTMDEFTYRNAGGENIVTLKKKVL